MLDKFFKEIRDNFRKESRVNLKVQLERIKDRAAKVHRYNIQSGNLSRAVEDIVHDDYNGEAVLNGSISGAGQYDKFVHDGHRGWEADPFLTNAGEYLEESIQESFSKSLDESINGAI